MRKLLPVGLSALAALAVGFAGPSRAGTVSGGSERHAIAEIVQRYHTANHFDGVVLVARKGRVLYAGGVGLADRKRGTVNAPTTPYRICSITKQFTALLVMQQVQAGRLNLDAPITTYLPNFPHAAGNRISARHLLQHTSGLANMDDFLPAKDGVPGFYTRADPRFMQPAYVINTFLGDPLKTEPGEKFNYNNADYVVLQAILERQTGKSFARLLNDRILRPLGMRHTGLLSKDRVSPAQALGYVVVKGRSAPEPYQRIANFGAAGAMFSTAEDLRRWDAALLKDTLLARKYRDIMFTPNRKLGFVALGSWVFPATLKGVSEKPVLIDREGAIGAFNDANLLAPADGLSLLILSNNDSDIGAVYMGRGIAYDILKAMYSPSVAVKAQPPQ